MLPLTYIPVTNFLIENILCACHHKRSTKVSLHIKFYLIKYYWAKRVQYSTCLEYMGDLALISNSEGKNKQTNDLPFQLLFLI